MAQPEQLEVLVIGSGQAGKWITWELASAGRRTAVVERRWIGGSCPNINCLPSKNEIYSAKVADVVRHADAFGTEVTGARTNMAKVLARKRKMVEGEISAHRQRYRETGAELLELDRAPRHLVVLGGGYVGLEFAQAYRRFGSRVTVAERGPRLLRAEDPEVAEAVSRLLADEGVEVLLGAEPVRVEGQRGDLRLVVRTPNGESTVEASDVLAALGRTPNTGGIGLDVAGVALDGRGYIAVNERLETSAPGVWAVGECAGSPQFTHVAFDDFRVVRDNLAGRSRSTRGRLVPSCLFTDPPLARVGLNELEARTRGVAVRVASLPMQNVLRTETTDETRGFMKVLVAAQGDQILGFTMLGAEAGEVMAVVQTAMLGGMPYTALRDAIYAHPTMAEGLNLLFARVPGR